MNDFRSAIRQLLRNPGFAAVAAISLALGIGANTAIFSVVNAVLLRPLPYPQPGQLVQIKKDAPPSSISVLGGGELVGDREYSAWRRETRCFSKLAAYAGGHVNVSGPEGAERLLCGQVTVDFFPMLGVQPAKGRSFEPDEDRPVGPPVVLVSHGLWQRRFGGDPGLAGRSVVIDGTSHTVIGILPAGFQFPEPFDLWRPLALAENTPDADAGDGIRVRLLRVLGRLRPGVSTQQAQTELDVVLARLRPPKTAFDASPPGPLAGTPEMMPLPPDSVLPTDPTGMADVLPQPGGTPDSGDAVFSHPSPAPDGVTAPIPLFGLGGKTRLVGLHEQVAGNVRKSLLVLLSAVGLVLLIACANAANLFLARATTRRREMAVRAALGASRWRVVRQLLVESVLVAATAGVLGLILARWGIRFLPALGLTMLPPMFRVSVDAQVMAFSLVVSLLTGVLFGLAPALQASRIDLNEALKEGIHGFETASRRFPLRNLLVAVEVALALVLLTGAGLLLKSFMRLRSVEPGFRATGVLTTTINLTPAGYPQPHQQRAYYASLLERIRALPGVVSVGATDHLPLTDYSMMMMVRVEGRPAPAFEREPPVSCATVSPGYFQTMGIPLRHGRGFNDRDSDGAPHVAMVNDAFTRRYFSGENPLGKRITSPGSPDGWASIIGVAADVRQSGLDSDIAPEVYWCFLQQPSTLMSLAIRASNNPAALAPTVRAEARQLDPNQPIHTILTMEERLAHSMAPQRLNTVLLGVFAALALVLASVGIYGVLCFVVAQRSRDIGVRIALGADRADVLLWAIGQGMGPALIGLAIGLVGALALSRCLASLLFRLPATDPETFAATTVLLAAVALAACYLPARRAVRIDPVEILRSE